MSVDSVGGGEVEFDLFMGIGTGADGVLFELTTTMSSSARMHAPPMAPRTRVFFEFFYASASSAPQQCLYFLPLPHSQGALGPSLVDMVCLLRGKMQ